MASGSGGCGCKDVYRFHHTTYTYTPLVFVLFYSSIPTFCSFLKMFFVLYIIYVFTRCMLFRFLLFPML